MMTSVADACAHDRATKAALRERVLMSRRAQPPGQRAGMSAAICARLQVLPELAGLRTVLGYAPFGSEVDVEPFLTRLLEARVRLLLPWVEAGSAGVAPVTDLAADLAPGFGGIREPKAARRHHARPQEAEAVLAPAVAVDRRGNRLGYGGGYFDRLLGRVRRGTPVIAVVFDLQVVDAVPAEPHDRPVSVIVTDTRVLRPARQET